MILAEPEDSHRCGSGDGGCAVSPGTKLVARTAGFIPLGYEVEELLSERIVALEGQIPPPDRPIVRSECLGRREMFVSTLGVVAVEEIDCDFSVQAGQLHILGWNLQVGANGCVVEVADTIFDPGPQPVVMYRGIDPGEGPEPVIAESLVGRSDDTAVFVDPHAGRHVDKAVQLGHREVAVDHDGEAERFDGGPGADRLKVGVERDGNDREAEGCEFVVQLLPDRQLESAASPR